MLANSLPSVPFAHPMQGNPLILSREGDPALCDDFLNDYALAALGIARVGNAQSIAGWTLLLSELALKELRYFRSSFAVPVDLLIAIWGP